MQIAQRFVDEYYISSWFYGPVPAVAVSTLLFPLSTSKRVISTMDLREKRRVKNICPFNYITYSSLDVKISDVMLGYRTRWGYLCGSNTQPSAPIIKVQRHCIQIPLRPSTRSPSLLSILLNQILLSRHWYVSCILCLVLSKLESLARNSS